MGLNRSDDFRDWDLRVESSFASVDAAGLPFFLWRESADNRLMLSRPRYCCLTAINNELYFTFFNPAGKQSFVSGFFVFAIVAVLVATPILWSGQIERQASAHLDYVFDNSPPPFLSLMSAIIGASLAGTVTTVLWYVAITLWRWIFGRFESDGRITQMPLSLLEGFQVLHATEAGAMINNKPAKSGHGLAAVFADGTQVILTGNAWEYASIAERHRIMTELFCTRRAEFVRPWIERLRQASTPAPTTSGHDAGGVPWTL